MGFAEDKMDKMETGRSRSVSMGVIKCILGAVELRVGPAAYVVA